MIDHTLVTKYGQRPSPYGGLPVEYHCVRCNLDFTSAAPEPICPNYQDYLDGRRDGARTKHARTRLTREPWMTEAYRQGYLSGRGQQLRAPHPDAITDPEGHRESVMARAVHEAVVASRPGADGHRGTPAECPACANLPKHLGWAEVAHLHARAMVEETPDG